MEMSNLLARLEHDRFASSIVVGLLGRGYEVMHCTQEKNGFARLVYCSGTGDGSFEKTAFERGWQRMENGACCAQYERTKANCCGHCGAGVNGQVVYHKDLFPDDRD